MDKFKNFLSKFNIFRKSSKKGKSDSSPADYDQFEDSKIDVEIPDQLKKKGGDKLKSFGKKFTATMKARMAKASANTTAGPGINWNNIYQTVFSPQSRPFIHKSFLVLFFCGSTYFMGRLVALMIAPQTSIKKSAPNRTLNPGGNELRQQLAAIKNNDLFDAVGDAQTQVADKPKVDENLVCLEAKQKSSLPINLVSTIVLQDTVKSVASVQVRGQKTLEYLREGEKVGNLAQIGSIVDKKLIFKNLSSGQCEYVAAKEVREKQLAPIAVERNPQKGRKIIQAAKRTGIVNEGNNFKIKKSLRDEMMSDMSNILTQARAVQIQNPDGTLSFSMQEIVPGSIFSNLNIQDGDIINNINGKSISSLNEIMSQFGQLKTRDHYEITIKRNGEEITYDYDFVD